jgi:hypothetical protein
LFHRFFIGFFQEFHLWSKRRLRRISIDNPTFTKPTVYVQYFILDGIKTARLVLKQWSFKCSWPIDWRTPFRIGKLTFVSYNSMRVQNVKLYVLVSAEKDEMRKGRIGWRMKAGGGRGAWRSINSSFVLFLCRYKPVGGRDWGWEGVVGEGGREILHEKGAGRQAVGTRRHKAKKVRWSFPYAPHSTPLTSRA